MANSPTICQLYVGQALESIRNKYPSIKIIHYMDDILISGPTESELHLVYHVITNTLKLYDLHIAPDKVQQNTVGHFLGSVILSHQIKPQKLHIRRDHLKTLNDFQKLLGDINWIRPYLKIPTSDLKPLFTLLEGDTHLTSPRQLTPAALKALDLVDNALSTAHLNRINPDFPFQLCILQTHLIPTAVLWQNGPLLWIHSHSSSSKTISHYPTMVAKIAQQGLKAALTHFGDTPNYIFVPYTTEQVKLLASLIDEWTILICTYTGTIDNHYPKDPLLQFITKHPIVFPKITQSQPIPNALDIYTDGSKTGKGCYVANGITTTLSFPPDVPQQVECLVILEVFKRFHTPINIISDSQYVVNAVSLLETAGYIKQSSPVASVFVDIQKCILSREHPFFIQHIRAHSMLPGPMVKSNALADQATKAFALIAMTPIQAAKNFHSLYHVPASTLRLRFHISRATARDIVLQCAKCADFITKPSVGINPRGLKPLEVWQMDVTHISAFGSLQYVHTSIDTCSGVLHATPLTGERALHVIQHCLEAWSAWGKPRVLKTDNGPAYTSTKFHQFCLQMQVTHLTGLPYNPQGQGIVERAHRTIKQYILKQKGGMEGIKPTPRTTLSLTLFTLNFLNLDDHGRSAAERHGQWPVPPATMAKWKDILTNKWKGPDPILIRSRGAVCVFPQDEDNPIWVPERLVRTLKDNTKEEKDDTTNDDNLVMGNDNINIDVPDSGNPTMGHC